MEEREKNRGVASMGGWRKKRLRGDQNPDLFGVSTPEEFNSSVWARPKSSSVPPDPTTSASSGSAHPKTACRCRRGRQGYISELFFCLIIFKFLRKRIIFKFFFRHDHLWVFSPNSTTWSLSLSRLRMPLIRWWTYLFFQEVWLHSKF